MSVQTPANVYNVHYFYATECPNSDYICLRGEIRSNVTEYLAEFLYTYTFLQFENVVWSQNLET